MLADPIHFLHTLAHFKKEDITEEIINKLKDYIENPNFQPNKVNISIIINYIYLITFVSKYLLHKIQITHMQTRTCNTHTCACALSSLTY